MSIKIHKELHEKCIVNVPKGSHFTIYNLPFGIFKTMDRGPGVGIAIGDFIVDLRVLADHGIFKGIVSKIHFETKSLNSLISQGNELVNKVRKKVQELLTGQIVGFQIYKEEALVRQKHATMLLPVEIGDYTDFYSSIEHATNVGKLFRSKENALMPNWKHLPVGYHGRASSIVASGTPIKRPSGQLFNEALQAPEFGPSERLDFELELAFIVGKNSTLGDPVSMENAREHIFGFVLMNDWSARDIQKWEYKPLGPFLGKSFATAISSWVVTVEALKQYRTQGPKQDPEVLDYLKQVGKKNFNIQLEVELLAKEGFVKKVTEANSRLLYWSVEQQLAHHTVNGCNVRVGDLMASGTISGKKKNEWGSLLEQTFGGKETIKIHQGVERTFIEDGDSITITGWAGDGPYKIGFGEVTNTVKKS